jgi:CheY-like chemotaxis protein
MANILVVDDNEEILILQREILGRGGHQVTTAINGDEAIRLFRASQFDLVITDLIMPDKEGIETIRDLRKLNPVVKIIAMSGGGRLSAEDNLAIAQSLGASRTLAKPFSSRDLLEVVNNLLGETK